MSQKTVLPFRLALLMGVMMVAGVARSYAVAPPTAATAAAPYTANFTETRTIPGMTTPLVLHGTIRFTPGRHLLWAIEKPYSYRFEIADGTLTEVLPDGSRKTEPLEKTPWAQALFKLFSSLLGGDPHALARYFDLEPTDQGMILTPRSQVLAKWVTRIVAVGKPMPHKVTIVGSDSGKTVLEFTPLKPLPPPAAATTGA
ncbi:MAG: outer membrane lipoprotein carrier protein LolA [Gammaproteobacteria bacterium]|nr:outer membrane lipoprotein carrier protein LolA [Gammaproteobacteria bacterium]